MKIGTSIQRIREIKGIKQVNLAKSLQITQQRLSQIEQSDEIDDRMLQSISEALETTTDAIRNFKEEYAINNFNNFATNGQSINYQIVMTDKLIEVYEKLLQEKDKKIKFLEEQLKFGEK